jgi:hypothetical protein
MADSRNTTISSDAETPGRGFGSPVMKAPMATEPVTLLDVQDKLCNAILLMRSLCFGIETLSQDVANPLMALAHVVEDRLREVDAGLEELQKAQRLHAVATGAAALAVASA